MIQKTAKPMMSRPASAIKNLRKKFPPSRSTARWNIAVVTERAETPRVRVSYQDSVHRHLIPGTQRRPAAKKNPPDMSGGQMSFEKLVSWREGDTARGRRRMPCQLAQ